MRILFLSRWYPYPPDNGSKLRVHALLGGLCERHEVTLVSFFDVREARGGPEAGTPGPREARLIPYREFDSGSVRAVTGFLSPRPRFLVDTYRPEMDLLIREAMARTKFNLVIASQLPMAAYFRAFAGVPAVFEEVELGVYRPDDGGAKLPSRARARLELTWAKHRRFMSRLVRRFALCTVASEAERRLLASAAPGYRAVHVIPNSVEAGPVLSGGGSRDPRSLIFTGSLRYGPNHDAMEWFLDEVYPSVKARLKDARLTITGEPGPPLSAAGDGVVMTGRVPDVRPLLASSSISIAPIRTGGGTRLKILEAMAAGTPVVATSKAVEGLGLVDGEHAAIADSAGEFADAVNWLLEDPPAARKMAERAWSFVRQHYDSRVVVPEFLRLVEEAASVNRAA